MDTRKNEIKGILSELIAVAVYIVLLFAATLLLMR